MGKLVDAARKLPSIRDSDDWEQAVEALLIEMAEAVEGGVMRQADYTRKTQELAAHRRQFRVVGSGEPIAHWGDQ